MCLFCGDARYNLSSNYKIMQLPDEDDNSLV